jgi:hypothetical protein
MYIQFCSGNLKGRDSLHERLILKLMLKKECVRMVLGLPSFMREGKGNFVD